MCVVSRRYTSYDADFDGVRLLRLQDLFWLPRARLELSTFPVVRERGPNVRLGFLFTFGLAIVFLPSTAVSILCLSLTCANISYRTRSWWKAPLNLLYGDVLSISIFGCSQDVAEASLTVAVERSR